MLDNFDDDSLCYIESKIHKEMRSRSIVINKINVPICNKKVLPKKEKKKKSEFGFTNIMKP